MVIKFSLSEIDAAADLFWKTFSGKNIFAFRGEMGAGKTTFIHALCDAKKVNDTVGSPTFSLINEYTYEEAGMQKSIYHMDLYRIKNEAEARDAGLEDSLYSGEICLVEWPDKAPGIFPEETIFLQMETTDSGDRTIILVGK